MSGFFLKMSSKFWFWSIGEMLLSMQLKIHASPILSVSTYSFPPVFFDKSPLLDVTKESKLFSCKSKTGLNSSNNFIRIWTYLLFFYNNKKNGRKGEINRTVEGIIPTINRLYMEDKLNHSIGKYMSVLECSECHGERLAYDGRMVSIENVRYPVCASMSFDELSAFADYLSSRLDYETYKIVEEMAKENPKVHLLSNEKISDTILKFRSSIRLVKPVLADIVKRQEAKHSNLRFQTEGLEKADFYTYVWFLENGIKRILDDMSRYSSVTPNVKISFNRKYSDDFSEL